MKPVKAKLMSRVYPIHITTPLFGDWPTWFTRLSKSIARWAIVSDTNVSRLYGKKLLSGMKKAGLSADLVVFSAGERSKSRAVVASIEDKLFKLGMGRDSAIVALGGGVTGDIAGFVAATYMRGIPFVQAPTTLLAMVDSSVGGKTGIDVPAGKNLIGAFHQPIAVFIDPALLKTLPAAELRNGMAEVVKHAVISDKGLLGYLEKNIRQILSLDLRVMERVIMRNCSIKSRVVELDERESGLRQVLNYGHTAGHAVEKLSGYRMTHGSAVAIGMYIEGYISTLLGLMSCDDWARQNALLAAFGLNPKLSPKYKPEAIIGAMAMDKKARKGIIRMALPSKIGQMARSKDGSWAIPVQAPVIRNALLGLRTA